MSEEKKQFDLLIDYIKNRLSPEDHASMVKKIENDPILQKMIAVIEGMQNETDQIEWQKIQKPTHALFDRLLKDVKKRKSESDDKQGVTIFDSGLLPNPEGVRGAEVDTRRLKYIIDNAQLELSIYPISPKSFEIIGHIYGNEQVQSLTVELSGGKSSFKVEANKFNLFRIRRIPSGMYNLNLYDGQNLIGKIKIEL